MTVQEIIKNKPYLAWYVKDPGELSKEATLEHVLNYGNWNDVMQFFEIEGVSKSADLFSKTLLQNICILIADNAVFPHQIIEWFVFSFCS